MIMDEDSNFTITTIVTDEPHNFGQSSSIAYDWVHDHIYWIDFSIERILVSFGNGSFSTIVVNSGYITPQAITLHPGKGYFCLIAN